MPSESSKRGKLSLIYRQTFYLVEYLFEWGVGVFEPVLNGLRLRFIKIIPLFYWFWGLVLLEFRLIQAVAKYDQQTK